MPIKGSTRLTGEQVADLVRRLRGGESAAVLAKYYGYSKAGIYRLIDAFEKKALAKSLRADMTPADLEKADIRDLALQRDALKDENAKLKRRYIELVFKYNAFDELTLL